MTRATVLEVPEQWELVAFFEADPSEAAPHDGYWCYEVRDERGVILRFSFHIFERSVQTVVSLAGHVLVEVSHEGGIGLRVIKEGDGSFLVGECEHEGTRSKVLIRLKPQILVKWSTLTE